MVGGDGGLRDEVVTVTETLVPPEARIGLAAGPFEDEGAEILGRRRRCAVKMGRSNPPPASPSRAPPEQAAEAASLDAAPTR